MTSKELAEIVRQEFEVLARKHAKEQGFDIEHEPNGLFRAFMMAMSYNQGELLKEASRRARTRMEGNK